MATNGSDVVVIGGGIVGIATAYFLGKKGVRSLVVERDSVGSHASGFAYGGLAPLSGAGIPGPAFAVADEGMRLHRELSNSLPKETGINTEFRARPSLTLAFTEQEVREAKSNLLWQERQAGYTACWAEPADARAVEPRISGEALGAVYVEGIADVEPYRFVLALAQAAEKLGVTIRHGRVASLGRDGQRVTRVVLDNDDIPCGNVVIATGPWSGESSAWLGATIDVTPLKGQILRLRATGPRFECSVGWGGNYATTKPDGLLWAGTTEEEAGFDDNPSSAGRDNVMASLLKMVPTLIDAQLVQHTACVRPMSSDGLPLLGAVPGWEGVYMATGAGRKGILLGPAMGRITADLVTGTVPDIAIDAFDPGRFAG